MMNVRSVLVLFLVTHVAAILLIASFGTQARAESKAIVTPMIQQALDVADKEAILLQVDFPPGGGDPVHQHDAVVFVYVLSGAIVMQVEGGNEVTLTAGETFKEVPGDIHVVGRNASTTEPASFLAFFVKDASRSPVLPVE